MSIFCYVGTFATIEPVLSTKIAVTCPRTQHPLTLDLKHVTSWSQAKHSTK